VEGIEGRGSTLLAAKVDAREERGTSKAKAGLKGWEVRWVVKREEEEVFEDEEEEEVEVEAVLKDRETSSKLGFEGIGWWYRAWVWIDSYTGEDSRWEQSDEKSWSSFRWARRVRASSEKRIWAAWQAWMCGEGKENVLMSTDQLRSRSATVLGVRSSVSWRGVTVITSGISSLSMFMMMSAKFLGGNPWMELPKPGMSFRRRMRANVGEFAASSIEARDFEDSVSVGIFDGDGGAISDAAMIHNQVRELHERLSEENVESIGLNYLELNPKRNIRDRKRNVRAQSYSAIDDPIRALHMNMIARIEGDHVEGVPDVLGDGADLRTRVEDTLDFLRVVDPHRKRLHVCAIIRDNEVVRRTLG
jgi:hypothetical protein